MTGVVARGRTWNRRGTLPWMERVTRIQPGFETGLGLLLTVFKTWLGVALLLALAGAIAVEYPWAAVAMVATGAAALLLLIRPGWLAALRDGLGGNDPVGFRTGLLLALVVALLGLWAFMTLLTVISLGAGNVTAAKVPGGLFLTVLAATGSATALAIVVMRRLRQQPTASSQ